MAGAGQLPARQEELLELLRKHCVDRESGSQFGTMTNPKLAPSRSRALHAALAAVAGVAVLGAAGAVWFASQQRHGVPSGMSALTTTAAPPAAPAAGPEKPSFDIVRVSPQGSSVIAGRAAPGAEVVVHQGTQELGHAQADPNGDWVLVPQTPLAPGARELTLSERTPQGHEVTGDKSVVLVVPPRPATPQPAASSSAPQSALAVLTGPNTAPRVLQGPAAPPGGTPRLTLDTLDYGNAGEVRFSGTAKPGSTVRVYVDGKPVGDATAQADGTWTLVPPAEVASGQHKLRLDELSAQGAVGARVELPFTRARMEAHDLIPGRIVVQPRQNLWLIARHSYGAGIRYTVIFQANRGQIRDPNLIYPGQVFTIPASAGAAMPNDSSKSR